jgi:beta-1,3-glucuronyltransferase
LKKSAFIYSRLTINNHRKLFQRPKAIMPYKAGFEEDGFLRSLVPFEPNEIELKAKNCTEVSYS